LRPTGGPIGGSRTGTNGQCGRDLGRGQDPTRGQDPILPVHGRLGLDLDRVRGRLGLDRVRGRLGLDRVRCRPVLDRVRCRPVLDRVPVPVRCRLGRVLGLGLCLPDRCRLAAAWAAWAAWVAWAAWAVWVAWESAEWVAWEWAEVAAALAEVVGAWAVVGARVAAGDRLGLSLLRMAEDLWWRTCLRAPYVS
jgi:hypothetical protein